MGFRHGWELSWRIVGAALRLVVNRRSLPYGFAMARRLLAAMRLLPQGRMAVESEMRWQPEIIC